MDQEHTVVLLHALTLTRALYLAIMSGIFCMANWISFNL
jgi:hypothetical protein